MRSLILIIMTVMSSLALAQEKSFVRNNKDSLLFDSKRDSVVKTDDSKKLKEALVVATAPMGKGSLFKYDARQAANTISVIGEPDVLRHIVSFPGIATGMEGTLGLFVRGGNCGSNGIYFNDVPIYVTTHFMGLFSVFPPEMVDGVTFYQGGISSYRGNVSSSLLDITAKKHYGEPYMGKFYISPYVCGIYNTLPIIKDKVSLQVSGRSTLFPYFLRALNSDDNKLKIDIYDITAKLDIRTSDKSFLDIMLFNTKDRYYVFSDGEISNNMDWGSTSLKAGWQYLISDKLSTSVTTYYSHTFREQSSENYNVNLDYLKSKLSIRVGTTEWCAKAKLDWNVTREFHLSAGASCQSQEYEIINEKYVITDRLYKRIQKYPNRLLAFHTDLTYDIPHLMDLRVGARYTCQKSESYCDKKVDVHALNHWYIFKGFGAELSYDIFNQFYHVLEGLPTGWDMNISVPGTNKYPAERTRQFYAGFFYKDKIQGADINITVGGYHRNMNNLLSYTNTVNAYGFSSDTWQEEVCMGKGTSRGIEFCSMVKTDRFSSSLSYTLSKTDRTYSELNRGNTFPFKFDRRHILTYEGSYTFRSSKKSNRKTEHAVGCAISYTSGNRLTLPVGTYKGVEPPYWDLSNSGVVYSSDFYNQIYDRQLMSDVNSLSTKDFFRTDVAYTLTNRRKKVTHELTFSVYNVFNRHNPYTIFNENGQWKQMSVVPIMPSVRWCLSW